LFIPKQKIDDHFDIISYVETLYGDIDRAMSLVQYKIMPSLRIHTAIRSSKFNQMLTANDNYKEMLTSRILLQIPMTSYYPQTTETIRRAKKDV
jgi:hypothetical protein